MSDSMDQTLFRSFCDLAYRQAGIVLKGGKEAMLLARIARRQRALGLGTPQEYFEYLESESSGSELVSFLDVVTTNFTHFFRESDHFDFLAERVRQALKAGKNRLRYWSAASSTGEEPYTMAITILEAAGAQEVDARILATDLSTQVLEKAQEGIYDAAALEPVPSAARQKYFERVEGSRGEFYQAGERLRSMVTYRRLNLSTPPFPMKGPLDAVFCRNVMIYFGHEVRQRLIGAVETLLGEGSFLAISHTETLVGIRTGLRTLQPSIYWKAAP
ncbi:MAG: protein-glutamate O-methyltransferase CheR [Myxococcales bacterium]